MKPTPSNGLIIAAMKLLKELEKLREKNNNNLIVKAIAAPKQKPSITINGLDKIKENIAPKR